MNDTRELLPCPFCGSSDIMTTVCSPSNSWCGLCFAQGPGAEKPTAAMAAWNRRAALASVALPEQAAGLLACVTCGHPIEASGLQDEASKQRTTGASKP